MNVCQGKEQRVDNCRYQRRLLVRLRTLNPVRWVGSRTSAVRAFDNENDEAYIHLNLNLALIRKTSGSSLGVFGVFPKT